MLPIKTYTKVLDMVDSYNEQKDELETVSAAYNDVNKELAYKKNELESLRKILDHTKTSLNKTDREVIKLIDENKKLKKSDYRMKGKNQTLGAKVMRLEKDLRIYDTSMWKEYKEAYKK